MDICVAVRPRTDMLSSIRGCKSSRWRKNVICMWDCGIIGWRCLGIDRRLLTKFLEGALVSDCGKGPE